MEIRNNQASLSSTCMRSTLLKWSKWHCLLNWWQWSLIASPSSTRPAIPTFSLTLTVCRELLAPNSTSKRVKGYTYRHDNGKTVRLGSDEHSLRKACYLRCCGSTFCGKISPKNTSHRSRLWRNARLKEDEMWYIFITVLLMKICMFLRSFVIFLWKRIAWEWRKSRFPRT